MREFGSNDGLAEARAYEHALEAQERKKEIREARAEADRLELVHAERTLERSRRVMAEMKRKEWQGVFRRLVTRSK